MKTGFCHADGAMIRDIDGKPLVFRGVGIGGWFLIEGYMIRSYGKLDRPRRLKDHIISLVDSDYADYFFDQWQRRFFTAQDVSWLAGQGFNMIRVAIDYQVFFEPSETEATLKPIESNFLRLDDIIRACSQVGVYVILDLHAAPGGQTGTNIDNSQNDHPDLFTKRHYQDQTIYVWETFAKRYKNEPTIAAYDLLNEPLPEWFAHYYDQVMPFYRRLIRAIRAIDPHHMISIEGVHWSTDWSIFEAIEDTNILLQFHKYWNAPDQESIQHYLNIGLDFNLPIFMGEGGENNLPWLSAAFKLYTQNTISYAFWAYKKMAAHNAMMSFKKPEQWSALLEGKLSKREAKSVLDALLDAIRFDQTLPQVEVANALLNRVPFTCPAYAFDYEGENRSFHRMKFHLSSLRHHDGLNITNIEGAVVPPVFKHMNGESPKTADVLVLRLISGEWVTYTFHVSRNQSCVAIEIQTLGALKAHVTVNDVLHHHKSGRLMVEKPRRTNTLRIQATDHVVLKNIVFT